VSGAHETSNGFIAISSCDAASGREAARTTDKVPNIRTAFLRERQPGSVSRLRGSPAMVGKPGPGVKAALQESGLHAAGEPAIQFPAAAALKEIEVNDERTG